MTPMTSDTELHASYMLWRKHNRNASAAAVEAGMSTAGFSERIRKYLAKFGDTDKPPIPPAPEKLILAAGPIPDPDMPIEQVLSWRRESFNRSLAHHSAKRWRKFNVPISGPYALMFFGDPHIDDDGCHLPLLESHCELAAKTEAIYAINIGDTTNNWIGRLERLWANQDASAKTAQKLARWLLCESGVPWFLWLHGNHDLWGGRVGPDWFAAIKPHFVAMDDWQAKVTLVSPNGHELRLWASHNFKGNSIWNNMHGLERAAQMQDWAHLYVAGHHHDTGLRQGENSHRSFCYWLMRVRGYKFMDDFADHHGFGEYQHGAAGLAVIDPTANKPNAVTCFLDPFEGAEFLAYKRRHIGGV